MNRTISALSMSGLIAFGAAASAQSPATTSADKRDSKDISVSGCVEKTKSGGYFLINAIPDSSATSRETGTSGSASTSTSSATTTTGSATTTSDAAKNARNGMTWNLGQADRLERYVGQQVRVTGRAKKDTSGDELKGTTGDKEIKARDMDVKSITMIAPSCR